MKTLSEKDIRQLKRDKKIDLKDVKPILKNKVAEVVKSEDKQLQIIEKALKITESQSTQVIKIATEYSDLTKQFISKLKDLKKPVDVNVDVNIPKQELIQPVRKWEFTVERGYNGTYITKIYAEAIE